ncbi:hypothetical protein FFLO_06245 [Filobasidium floriforme]|uniref:Uncharacterized protein n=1 Tax=Filobasidium floriforme TaxID=5210 RepID=A0A8K0JF87_9TREE|nr:uncharacterized protein HD553DRAFT_321884 [Filobasidium floriforme]KAG7528305.1 hypothetical protein FFLO_06245 [Filobasidium floriforme]KAH8089845.1 hypothetical protein HD553DRAFT_321884 [Filobasidium floriforme]
MTEEQEASRPVKMTMGDQRSGTPQHRLHLLSHSDQPTALQAVRRAIDQRSSPGSNITSKQVTERSRQEMILPLRHAFPCIEHESEIKVKQGHDKSQGFSADSRMDQLEIRRKISIVLACWPTVVAILCPESDHAEREAMAGERQTEVFEAWGLEGPGGVDTDMKRFHIGVIETIALEMPADDALKALGEAKQARVNRSSNPDDEIASDYCDRKGGRNKGLGLKLSKRDESSQKVDLASQCSQTDENNRPMMIGDESTAASDDEISEQTMGTQRPARGDSITPEPLDSNEQSGDPGSPVDGVTYSGGVEGEERYTSDTEMLDCDSQEEQ